MPIFRILCGIAAAASLGLGATVVQNVSVVDVASGAIRSSQTVLLDGESIRVVDRIPHGATVVEGRGKFLMPGLWDAHARLEGSGPRELHALLSQGITGVRDVGTSWEAIQSMRRQSPLRIVGSGHPVEGANAIEARRAFDVLWEADADFVTPSANITPDGFVAMAEQARHWRVPFGGPIPPSVSPWYALEARQITVDGIGSLKHVTDATLTRFFDQCSFWNTRFVPLLATWRRSSPQEANRTARVVAAARESKVVLLAGSGGAGGSLLAELRELAAAGWAPQDVLRSATVAPTKLWGGSDWVVLNANPLVSLDNLEQIAGVVVNGSWLPRAK